MYNQMSMPFSKSIDNNCSIAAVENFMYASTLVSIVVIALKGENKYACVDLLGSLLFIYKRLCYISVSPTITQAPTSKLEDTGASEIFTCKATGVPKPTITWSYLSVSIYSLLVNLIN